MTADKHPAVVLMVMWGLLTLAFLFVSSRKTSGFLLGAADPLKRHELYSQVSNISVAMLAVTLTVLSILLALPDEARSNRMRQVAGYTLLLGTLLTTAFLWLVTVALAFVGVAIDDGIDAHETLTGVVAASALTASFGVLLSGVAFGLLIWGLGRPDTTGQIVRGGRGRRT